MENKYYTPDISELYVGYETYWIKDHIKELNEDNLVPVIFTSKKLSSTLFPPIQWEHEDTDDFKPNLMSIRTKYLDSDDIISLGFDQLDVVDDFFGRNNYLYKVPKDLNIMIMDGFKVSFLLKHEQGKIRIEKRMFGGFTGTQKYNEQVYYGACKSKNELKKILEWIK